ncbi:hypothetical protein RFI_09459 [Reticulomyxa filosa]|uniref:Possible tRNA binding domain-containing protein n=1 Tax=Reticulomyxa filosa TaxID=46433 RepID=X6NNT4_RETFI|nr:hypothetical protein RFI_09459 [Reticulomyxa filosa]|eukprot:ETO27676.1 hypothetical protein RFI_09459 [Reticulomyxa filosa]
MLFSDWDLKRLEKYCQNLFDYRLVLDLIPTLTRLFFSCEMDIQLNYSQCAILLGMGLQHRNIENISTQMGIVESQTTSSLNKALRKMQKYLESVIETYVRKTEIEPTLKDNNMSSSNDKNEEGTTIKNEPTSWLQKKKEEENMILEQRQKEELDDELEAKYYHEKEKQKKLAHLKEYSTSHLNDNPELLKAEERGEIPSGISVKVGEKSVITPRSLNDKFDPKIFQDLDKSKGINPGSVYFHHKKNKIKKGKNSKKTSTVDNKKINKKIPNVVIVFWNILRAEKIGFIKKNFPYFWLSCRFL